ncbi:FAD/NAD(P)-binding domain-containing protein [Rhizodiscina lignyota]|uniref:FAD/NAD(P)-binding domain-containing protein n=1 Tax=Rhizodiscina lignyota TaxID=1504668 RepID=A0A9P4IMZ9_9PEZI|nr:FAD/NAD(P)-binding domain-containing protein [Rhizodiscina lignyota]
MHIIVVGCGLAGLTAAIALARAGHKVEIVEAAPQIAYVGAGIQVSPNSSRVLRKLGVDKYIEKYCTEPVDLRMMRWENGKKLVECPLKKPSHDEYGSPYWHVHRADFHRGLLECALELGIVTHLDNRIVDIDAEAPSLTSHTGRRFTADLIVASDGLNSKCREVVVGHASPPIPTGQMVYRVTIPARKLKGIPGLEEMITTPRNNHWIGPYGTILSYLLEGINETLVNLVMTIDVNGRMPDGVNQRLSSADAARAAFKGWDPRVDQMLEHAEHVLEWRLFTHHEIPSWAHSSKKLIIIGDACHAMTPYLAQGAAMGIEDAAILGGLLEKYPTMDTIGKVITLYERLRIKRTARVAEASIDSRYFTQMPDGPKQEERDAWLVEHPGIWKGHINIRSRKEFLDWLFGYDAYKALNEAIQAEEGGDSAGKGTSMGVHSHVAEIISEA